MSAILLPSKEVLNQLLSYEPETGRLFWKERPVCFFNETEKVPKNHSCARWNRRFAHKEAFLRQDRRGYLHGRLLGPELLAHRVIYKMVTGVEPEVIDHVNGQPGDNRFVNLRSVKHEGNARNLKLRVNNTSGVCGVSFCRNTGKWVAQIQINKKRVMLGRFETKEEAVRARKASNLINGYHSNHGVSRNDI